MKRVCLPLLALSLLPMLGHAENMSFTGSGKVSQAPDHVTLVVEVKSVCQPGVDEATLATDAKAKEVVAYFDTLIDSSNGVESVKHQHGFTGLYQKEFYDGKATVVVCPDTYQKSSTIVLTSKNVDDFGPMFANILKAVGNMFPAKNDNNVNGPLTYVTINSPDADVCAKDKEAMRFAAMRLAILDAQKQIKIFSQACGIPAEEIKYTPTTGEMTRSRNESNFDKAARYAESVGHPAIRSSFDDIVASTNFTLSVSFPQIAVTCTPNWENL